jgi:hypothetical protein
MSSGRRERFWSTPRFRVTMFTRKINLEARAVSFYAVNGEKTTALAYDRSD